MALIVMVLHVFDGSAAFRGDGTSCADRPHGHVSEIVTEKLACCSAFTEVMMADHCAKVSGSCLPCCAHDRQSPKRFQDINSS